MAGLTPSQTVGPFFHYALTPAAYGFRELVTNDLTAKGEPGPRIRLDGRVTDGDGAAVPDAMIEIWQADAEGRYAHPGDPRGMRSNAFTGFGRCPTDADGRFSFTTVKPGLVPAPDGRVQAPHILVTLLARGLLDRLVTRIYFAGELANDDDPILALIPEADRRATLMAQPAGEGAWHFDIRLQGEGETVFFDV